MNTTTKKRKKRVEQDCMPWPREAAEEYRRKAVPMHTRNQWVKGQNEWHISNPVYALSEYCRVDPESGMLTAGWTLSLNPPPLPPYYGPREPVVIAAGQRLCRDKASAIRFLWPIRSMLGPCFRTPWEATPAPGGLLDYFCYQDTLLPFYGSVLNIEPWKYLYA